MALGYILALLCALFNSLQDGFKKLFVKEIRESQVVFIIMGTQSIFTWIIFLLTEERFRVKPSFWFPWLGTVIINTVAQMLYIRSLKLAPLSLTTPFVTLTPLFLLINGKVILGEFPTFYGLIGVILIFSGSWFLYQTSTKDLLSMLNRDKIGILLMILVSFLWSISSILDKLAINNSSPLFHAASAQSGISILVGLYSRFIVKSNPFLIFSQCKIRRVLFWIAGGLGSLALIFQFYSLLYIQVVYVISIKRGGVILSVVIGWLYFKEKRGIRRLLPSILMIVGSILIIIYG